MMVERQMFLIAHLRFACFRAEKELQIQFDMSVRFAGRTGIVGRSAKSTYESDQERNIKCAGWIYSHSHLHTQIHHFDNSVVISLSFTNTVKYSDSVQFPFVLLLPAEKIMTENRWKITCCVSAWGEGLAGGEARALYLLRGFEVFQGDYRNFLYILSWFLGVTISTNAIQE